jgi:hypothetical protein
MQNQAKSEVLSAVLPKIRLSWDISPRRLVNTYRRLDGTRCFRFRALPGREDEGTTFFRNVDNLFTSPHGVISQATWIFNVKIAYGLKRGAGQGIRVYGKSSSMANRRLDDSVLKNRWTKLHKIWYWNVLMKHICIR